MTRAKSKTKCEGCKFWSELVAHATGDEPIRALCLNPESRSYQKMVHTGCDKKIEGPAIDDPDFNSHPQNRPFTRMAAEITGGKEALKALDSGRCPICKGPIGEFRDALSRKEYGISGMCQTCQDGVFK
jgi:hypothetical protein